MREPPKKPVRRPLVSPWTAEQDTLLKQMAAQGVSALRAAAALKRNPNAVRVRARKFGILFPSVRERRKKWAECKSKKNDLSPLS